MEKRTHNRKGVGKKILAIGLVLSTLLLPKFMHGSQKSRSPQKEKAPISLILGARKGFGNNESYGGGLGIKVGKIGFGLEGDWYSDKISQDIKENVVGDIYLEGKEKLEKISYIGAFAEFYPGLSEKLSLVLGIGGGFKKGVRNIEEKLLRNEVELALNKTSTSLKKESALKFYAGLIFDFTKNISAGPFVGYEKSPKENVLESDGFYAGIKANLKIK